MKSLIGTSSKNLSSNPLYEACSGFQVAAGDSKSCLKAGFDMEKIDQ